MEMKDWNAFTIETHSKNIFISADSSVIAASRSPLLRECISFSFVLLRVLRVN